MTATNAPATPRRRRGDGGVSQNKDGLWIGIVELPRDALTGKRRTAKVSSMSEAIMMRKLNQLKIDLANQGNLPTGSETVATWLDYWMTNINRSRPKTRDGYRAVITHIKLAIGKIKLAALTPADVRKVEARMIALKKSPTYALQAYRVLAKALKDAEREGRVFRNVARLVDPPVKAVPQVKVLTASEGIAVIKSVVDERMGSRYVAALLTGARQGELLGLEIDRVDFERDEIDLSWQLQRVLWKHGLNCKQIGTYTDSAGRVRPSHECGQRRGAGCPTKRIDAPANWEHRHIVGPYHWSRPKSKAGWRIIPLVEPLRSILERRIEIAQTEPNPHGLVWTADPKKSKGGHHHDRTVFPLDGSPVDPSRDNKAWHLTLKKAEVTDVRLHDARHTAVTILYDLGVPETTIQDIVGQSTISVTRGYRAKSRRLPAEALAQLGQALSAELSLSDLGIDKPLSQIER